MQRRVIKILMYNSLSLYSSVSRMTFNIFTLNDTFHKHLRKSTSSILNREISIWKPLHVRADNPTPPFSSLINFHFPLCPSRSSMTESHGDLGSARGFERGKKRAEISFHPREQKDNVCRRRRRRW